MKGDLSLEVPNPVPGTCPRPFHASPAIFISVVMWTRNADICNIYTALIIRILIIKQPNASTSGTVLDMNF